MSSSISRISLGLWAAIALLLLSGCDFLGSNTTPLSVQSRLIVDEPAAEFKGNDLRDSRTINLLRSIHGGQWEVRHGSMEGASDKRMRLVPDGKLARMLATLDEPSSRIGGVQIEFTQSFEGQIVLYWAQEGEVFHEERQVATSISPGTKIVELALTQHLPVGRLRLDFGFRTPQTVGIREIRATQNPYRREALATAAQSPWRVELDHELRPALLALPGLERSWEVDIPESPAQLSFAFGTDPQLLEPMQLRLRVHRGGSTPDNSFIDDLAQLDFGGQTGLKPGLWHEQTIDVSDFAGETVRLEFIAESEADLDALSGIGFLGNPMVLGKPQLAKNEEKPPNVVLISIDTLRADHLSLYGYERTTSPNIDAWAEQRAVTFKTTVASAPWTLPSHISMFTGIDAVRHGFNFSDPAPPSLTLLARRLQEAGYVTKATTGGGFVGPHYGLDQGFDVFNHWSSASRHGDQSKELELGMEKALSWFDGPLPEPFFLFFHTYEVHGPYRPREPYFSQFDTTGGDPSPIPLSSQTIPPNPEGGFRIAKALQEHEGERRVLDADAYPRLRDLYDSGIAYMDAQLARLFERLEAEGLADDTLVILTSDHGEALGEHGIVGHSDLYDFNLLIPLVIAFPGGEGAGTVFDEQVRTVDVTPTVLETVGLGVPPNLDGVSLVPAASGEEGFVPREAWSYAPSTNVGVALRLGDRFKLIFNHSAWDPILGLREFFRIDTDPGETENLADSAEQTDQLLARMKERFAEDLRALHCDFVNDSDDPFQIVFFGKPLMAPLRVKTFDMPGQYIEWKNKNHLLIDVPAQTSYRLYFEGFGNERFEVSLPGIHEKPEDAFQVDLASVANPWGVRQDPGGWAFVTEDDAKNPGVGVSCLWSGTHFGSGEQTQEIDPALAEQLQALGYL